MTATAEKPQEKTPTAQLLPFRCQSRKCKEDMEEKREPSRVMFLPDGAVCPVCQSRKYLHQLAIVHLLSPCDEDDPAGLQGRNGKWKIACGATLKEAKRVSTERDVTDGDGFFSASIVTCAKCRELTQDAEPPKRNLIEV